MYKEDEDFASCSSKENDETEALSKEEKSIEKSVAFLDDRGSHALNKFFRRM